jgi:hyperosmotically inducible protein
MNMRNLFFRLLIILAFAAFISAGCTTTKNTGVAIKEGSSAVGKQVGEGAEDVGKKVEDASITSAIKMKFANDELVSASTINVDTNQGHVTLTGTVDNQAAFDRAMVLGRSVDGVKTVHSNLTIPTRRK